MLFLLTGAVAGITLCAVMIIVLGLYVSIFDGGLEGVCWPDTIYSLLLFGIAGAGINFLFRLYEVAL